MKERLGWLLLVLAVIALLAGVRLPDKPETLTFAASGRLAEIAPVPVQRGEVPANWADADTLMTLPGIGPVLAGEIIREREARGPFFYPEDLEDVKGIGPKRLEAIYDMLDLSSGETGG